MTLADDLLKGVPEIARYVGKTERATYHLIYNNQIPHFKIGGRIHARKSELEANLRAGVIN
ncbi:MULTISPECIES: AlpA family transcriptional regulator [Sphingobium]|uniref:helix-turn-helix transcriptional regulator n=1 Tax=Sphingobium TaxID=165695 RepID=UPI000C07DBB0|nr:MULTISPECIES: helix-turn-helix domain-containing protein [Sphingobium]